MSPRRKLALSWIAGAGVIFVSAAAAAEEQAIVITAPKFPHGHELANKKVTFGDLNLATAAGQTELDKRVALAINEVCPDALGNVPHYQRQDAAACRKYAWSKAKPQMKDAIAAAKEAHGI